MGIGGNHVRRQHENDNLLPGWTMRRLPPPGRTPNAVLPYLASMAGLQAQAVDDRKDHIMPIPNRLIIPVNNDD